MTEINLSHVLNDLVEVQHESNAFSADFKEDSRQMLVREWLV